MRSWISLAVLFLVVAALGAWVYQRPEPPQARSHTLSNLKPQEVTQIRLVLAASPEQPIVLKRESSQWRMLEPVRARVDAFQIERLLGVLATASEARYAAADLARYGLDKPQATLTLNEESFSFGAVNTMTREQYVLTAHGVHAIPLAQRTSLPRDANALLSRALLGADEVPVRLEGPGFAATLNEGTWAIEPARDDVGADERNAWIDSWRNATALQVQRSEAPVERADVKIGLKDGRSVALAILQREPELIFSRADERIQYHFPAEQGRRLLSLPPSRGEAQKK